MPSYRSARRIAYGGMAEVFLAARRGPGGFEKLVVVKRILPQLRSDEYFVEMFLAEARLAASLRHPSIVAIYDVQHDGQQFEILMEYLSGPDLRQVLDAVAAAGQRIPIAVACHVSARIADALHCAHTAVTHDGAPQAIIHRDVSPSNVMVTYDGYVKVVDFGVAKAEGKNRFTRSGAIKGKVLYASPEQIEGADLQPSSDLFSLGSVLYLLLTGEHPFAGPTSAAAIYNIMQKQVVPPSRLNPEVPPELDALVLRMLERDPARRVATAAEVRDQLEAIEQRAGGVSTRAVGAWLSALMADDLHARRALEASIIQSARLDSMSERTSEIAAQEPDDSVAHSLLPAKAASQPGSQGMPAEAPRSRGRAVLLLLALASGVGAAVAAVAVSQQDRAAPAPAPAPGVAAPAPGIAAPAPAASALQLYVAPPDATVAIDGAPMAERVGASGLRVPVPADRDVVVVVSKAGFRSHEATLRTPASGVMPVYITLTEAPDATAAAGAVEIDQVAGDPASPPAPDQGQARHEGGPAPAAAADRRRSRRSERTRPAEQREAEQREAEQRQLEALATLVLEHEPAHAVLRVDGTEQPGSSPRTLTFTASSHTVALSAPGYVPQARSVTLAAGERKHMRIELTRTAPALPAVEAPAPPLARPQAPVSVRASQVVKVSGSLPAIQLRRDQVGAQVPRETKPISARLCIDTGGKVTSVKLMKNVPSQMTGPLERALAAWRYQPYQRDGRAAPACFAIEFTLRVELR
jgi:serine/threonine-protein kinase